jgi:NADP-dependent 3-hydroxy acid dehydrogenase YdfG
LTFQSISPGVVKTDFFVSSGTKVITPDAMYASNPYLMPKDVADAVLYALGCPPQIQVIVFDWLIRTDTASAAIG